MPPLCPGPKPSKAVVRILMLNTLGRKQGDDRYEHCCPFHSGKGVWNRLMILLLLINTVISLKFIYVCYELGWDTIDCPCFHGDYHYGWMQITIRRRV